MLCRWISEFSPWRCSLNWPLVLTCCRYEIANGDAAWQDAEKQIRASVNKGGSVPATVSVKSSKPAKRKAGESAREIYEKEIGSKEKKRIKKGTEGRR